MLYLLFINLLYNRYYLGFKSKYVFYVAIVKFLRFELKKKEKEDDKYKQFVIINQQIIQFEIDMISLK